MQDALTDHSMADELDLVCSDPEEIDENMICLKILERKLKSLKRTFMLDGTYYSRLENKEGFADINRREIFD